MRHRPVRLFAVAFALGLAARAGAAFADFPLSVETTSLPGAATNLTYGASLTASGGSAPYIWCGPNQTCLFTVPAGTMGPTGTLPEGVLLSPDGRLAGVPLSPGSSTFSVLVSDSLGRVSSSTALELQVVTLDSISVAIESLPGGLVGSPYSARLSASGGTPPFTWTLLDARHLSADAVSPDQDLGSALPAQLVLTPSGELSGTPQVPGRFQLIVEVEDSNVPPGQATSHLFLDVQALFQLQVLEATLPAATVGVVYNTALSTNAGPLSKVSFNVVDGAGNATVTARESLPAGLVLTANGILSGIPTTSGNFAFNVGADDGQGHSAIQAISLEVGVGPPGAGKGGGCTTAGGGLSVGGVLALLLWRRRWVRE